MPEGGPGPIVVVGVADDRLDLLGPEARRALVDCDVLVASRPHLDLWAAWAGRSERSGDGPLLLEIGTALGPVVAEVRLQSVDRRRSVVLLAPGDPGFFGVVRALVGTVDRRSLRVLPAPSAVSVAFARLGLPWDDAAVVAAQGASLAEATGAIRVAAKVAVLTSPGAPPEALGRALQEAGVTLDLVAVCSRLGSADETVRELSLVELAEGSFDPESVVVLIGPGGLPLVGWGTGASAAEAGGGPLAFGLARGASATASATEAQVRAAVLARLGLPAAGVLWDVGAGRGVGLEAALVRPGLTVLAVEEVPAEAARVTAEAAGLGAGLHVVSGRVPEVLDGLPAPDRAYVGAGRLAALAAVLERLRPGGRVVATFTGLAEAAAAAELLGHLDQLATSRGERGADGSWQLVAQDPVFVAWGPGGPPGPSEAP